ncbi:hypothetical protein GPECTOR_10g1052 [Gonium pectorale]|uniref:Uncharacterized protein n=1 Tax=Gonium pectorale TaxID=33097 RepID=A0A150GQC1_GONPE|nr:hypothetical protein GPECTOR_10g1052 [Gonium pectorale]|eukprot:KXZ52029.1 hypothetical protein GPECTOR_10g1052 [Gonium pectorale]
MDAVATRRDQKPISTVTAPAPKKNTKRAPEFREDAQAKVTSGKGTVEVGTAAVRAVLESLHPSKKLAFNVIVNKIAGRDTKALTSAFDTAEGAFQFSVDMSLCILNSEDARAILEDLFTSDDEQRRVTKLLTKAKPDVQPDAWRVKSARDKLPRTTSRTAWKSAPEENLVAAAMYLVTCGGAKRAAPPKLPFTVEKLQALILELRETAEVQKKNYDPVIASRRAKLLVLLAEAILMWSM